MADLSQSATSAAAAVALAAYYNGFSTGNQTWSSLSWAGVNTVLALTDVDQVGITRANSDFTISAGGVYKIEVIGNAANTAAIRALGFRARVNGADPVAGPANCFTQINSGNQLAANLFSRTIALTAGAVLTLQYVASTAFAQYTTPGTVDGVVSQAGSVLIYRIGA